MRGATLRNVANRIYIFKQTESRASKILLLLFIHLLMAIHLSKTFTFNLHVIFTFPACTNVCVLFTCVTWCNSIWCARSLCECASSDRQFCDFVCEIFFSSVIRDLTDFFSAKWYLQFLSCLALEMFSM